MDTTTLIDFLNQYRLPLAIGACVVLTLCYRKVRYDRTIKTVLMILIVFFAAESVYTLATGKSILSVAGLVDQKLSEEPTTLEPSHRYYRDPKERYGPSE